MSFLKFRCNRDQILSKNSCVARAFSGGRAVHPEEQIEEKNEVKLRKNERKYQGEWWKMRKCSLLAHPRLRVWPPPCRKMMLFLTVLCMSQVLRFHLWRYFTKQYFDVDKRTAKYRQCGVLQMWFSADFSNPRTLLVIIPVWKSSKGLWRTTFFFRSIYKSAWQTF